MSYEKRAERKRLYRILKIADNDVLRPWGVARNYLRWKAGKGRSYLFSTRTGLSVTGCQVAFAAYPHVDDTAVSHVHWTTVPLHLDGFGLCLEAQDSLLPKTNEHLPFVGDVVSPH